MIEDAYVKTKSGVVVCRDNAARTSYLQQKQIAEKKNSEIDSLRGQINTMQEELSTIKKLLTDLLNKDS